MQTKETFVQQSALFLQNTDYYHYARLAQHLYAASGYLRVGVLHPDYDTSDTLLYNQFGARRCFPIMAARLQTDKQCAVFVIDDRIFALCIGKAVYFCMGLTELPVPTFANDGLITVAHQYRPHHGVGGYIVFAQSG